MTLTQVLADESTTASEKLTAVAEIVAKARKAYGNEDLEITSPEVQTTEGFQPLVQVSDKDKVALVSQEVKRIKAVVYEGSQAT